MLDNTIITEVEQIGDINRSPQECDVTETLASDVKSAMDILRRAMVNDPDYAWGWHCNIAMAAYDNGLSHSKANKSAAFFMKLAFNVDTTNNKHYKTN